MTNSCSTKAADARVELQSASANLADARLVHVSGHKGMFVEHSAVIAFQEAVANYLTALEVADTRQDTWKPIETAPTDGTPVLLFDPDVPEVTVGTYDSDSERWGDDRARGFPINPPCWQELPALPDAQDIPHD